MKEKTKELMRERGMRFATKQNEHLLKMVTPKEDTKVFYIGTKKNSKKPNRGMTIAVENISDKEVVVGFSFCRKTDQFDKFEGRSRAINRARLFASGDESRKAVIVPSSGSTPVDIITALHTIEKRIIPSRYWKVIRKGFKINDAKLKVDRTKIQTKKSK